MKNIKIFTQYTKIENTEDGFNVIYDNDIELTDDILLKLGFKYWTTSPNQLIICNVTPLTLDIGNITLYWNWDGFEFHSACMEGAMTDLSHIKKLYQLQLFLLLYTGKEFNNVFENGI